MDAVIIIILVLMCVFAVKSYLKKVAHGCCGAGGDKEQNSRKNADLSEYKHRYSAKISGMSCKNCALRIENAFNRQEGIFVRVDFKSGLAEFASKEQIPENLLRKTIVELGYSVDEIKK